MQERREQELEWEKKKRKEMRARSHEFFYSETKNQGGFIQKNNMVKLEF